MPLQYIIDGYNAINHPLFARRDKKISKNPRKALVEFIIINRLCGSPKNQITVVFDGYSSDETELKQSHNNITIIFSQEESADDKIKKIAENSETAKNIIVVSDDNEIRFFVKSLGIRCIGINEFIGRDKKNKVKAESDSLKPELNYSQVHKINQELRKIWLE